VIIAFVVFTALIVTTAITGFKVSTLASSLAKVVSYADVIKKDIKSTDLAALSTDLDTLDDLTQNMLVSASDPVLSATLDGVPVAGEQLDAIRSIAGAVAGLTSAARPLAKLLPALEPKVLVQDGRYNTKTLTSLDAALVNVRNQLTISSKQVDGIELNGLNSKLAAVIKQISPALDGATTLVAQLEPLVAILPIMLSSSGDRTWFVALQNLSEARGTGGIFGAYSVVTTNSGALTLTSKGSDRDFIDTPVPLTGLPADFVSTEGDNVNDWRTINVSPNFPYTGQLVQNEWKAVKGQDVDGVIAFGQGIVQYLLAATGPITIDGTTVSAANVVQFLSLGVYAKYPDATDKNAFVSQLVGEIFTKLQHGSFDLNSLLTSTAGTPTSDRVLAWSPHADVEAQITAAGLDGALSNSYGPNAVLTINNGGGNKLEQFLHVKANYALGACTADTAKHTRKATLTVTLTNDAPTSGLPAYVTPREDYASAVSKKPVGSNLEVVTVYLPVDAVEGDTTLDGEDTFGYVGVESKRDELAFSVDLNPGQSKTLVVPWVEPTVGPTVVDMLSSKASVTTQPSLNPILVTTPGAKTCP
jgi:Protein of unknown function (DUF4012)